MRTEMKDALIAIYSTAVTTEWPYCQPEGVILDQNTEDTAEMEGSKNL